MAFPNRISTFTGMETLPVKPRAGALMTRGGVTIPAMAGACASRALSPDTTADADAVQIDTYRRLGGARRVAAVFRLNQFVRDAATAGIRRRHPEYSEEQVRRDWQRLVLGDELLGQVFPDRVLVDP